MQVFGQHDPVMYVERVTLANRFDHGTQYFDVSSQQVVTLPLQQVDSEEVGSTWMPGASVVGHGHSIAE